MTYEVLIAEVARRALVHPTAVRDVLLHLPDVLVEMEAGETVRTPLGVFRMVHGRERPIILPDRETPAVVPTKRVVKLKPGTKLLGTG